MGAQNQLSTNIDSKYFVHWLKAKPRNAMPKKVKYCHICKKMQNYLHMILHEVINSLAFFS